MKPIYIESDEEITSIVDKLTSVKDKKLAVVLPKNSALLQSLISLRLLVKEAKKHQKEVVIVTDSKVGSRLARQVGLEAYPSVERLPAASAAGAEPETKTAAPAVVPVATLPGGIRVNQYLGERQAEAAEQEATTEPDLIEPVSEPLPAAELAVPLAGQVGETEAEESQEKAAAIDESIETKKEEPPADEPTAASADLPPIIARSGPVGFSEKHEFHIPWRALVVALVLLIISGVLVTLFLPKAQVKLTVSAELTSQSLTLTAGEALATSDSVVPGSVLSVIKDLNVAITATGKKDIGTKATGSITITNRYKDGSGAGRDQSFAAGTKVTDDKTKKVFVLNSAVGVGKITYNPNTGAPIYQSATVGITATEPGESYNLSTATLSLAGALTNTTVSLAGSITGGQTKTVTVLSQDDITKAVEAAKLQAATEGNTEIKTQAGNKTLLDGASWQTVTKQTVDKEVGSQVASATASLSVEVGAVVFEQQAAKDKLDAALRQNLTAEQDLARPEDKAPTLVVKALAADRKSLILAVSGEAYIVPKLAKRAIAEAIANKSVVQAQDILKNTYHVSETSITVSPAWWPRRLPILAQAIMVEYGFNAVSGT